ncbi:MAG: hypothetical protein OZ921_19835 [Sorangiineae bacterium]|nr:hypothetical protein [Polyangiaceae bacterium]MEB2324777.1 hypothetical protein [Sorangiineae bacterium]
MTRLHLVVLHCLFHAASRGKPLTAPLLATRLELEPSRLGAVLSALEDAGLARGLRLTLPGLAWVAATRPAGARRAPALAA